MKTNIDTIITFDLAGILEFKILKNTIVVPVKCGRNKIYYALANHSIIYHQYPYLMDILQHHLKYHYLFMPENIIT